MVKRDKSPDTAEDEKYFTVYQPYPLNANWELPSDYIAFSRWIAACIGTDPIHALHYKPSARGMVLIEIDKKYPYNERLLGEHRWKEFLRRPTEEETDRVTQIFHSLYTTGREAQKDGWKRIHVEAKWFKDWSPRTNFVDEYPTTYWCSTPAEDRTNKPICRPLPVKVKPPPPKPAPPVPGSADWVSSKGAPSQTTPQAQKSAWNKARKPKVVTSGAPAPAAAWNSPITPVAPSPVRSNPTVNPTAAAPKSAWGKPIQKSPTSPAATPPAFPPGLNIRPTPGSSVPVPPGLTRPLWSDEVEAASASGSGSRSESPGHEGTEEVLGALLEQKVTISLSPSQDREFYGLATASPELVTDVIHPWEANIPSLDSTKWVYNAGEPAEDLWGEDTGPKGPAEIARCPYHETTCKKGVCTWRAKQVKEEEKQKAAASKKKDERGKGGKGGWRQNPSSPSDAGDDDAKDGFANVGGRNKGRRTGPGRGRESRGGDNASSEAGSYKSGGKGR